MTTARRKQISLTLILILTVFAFYNSYMHGVQLVRHNMPEGSPLGSDYVVASIPEVLLISCILRGADWRSVSVGSLSVIWTLWVNLAAAQHTPAGVIVALVPPVAALLLLSLADHDLTELAPVKRRKAQPRVTATVIEGQAQGSIQGSKVAQKRLTASSGSGSGSGVKSGSTGSKHNRGVEWAQAQEVIPTAQEIMIAMDVSAATAKRIRRVVTGVTGSPEKTE